MGGGGAAGCRWDLGVQFGQGCVVRTCGGDGVGESRWDVRVLVGRVGEGGEGKCCGRSRPFIKHNDVVDPDPI